MRNQRIKKILCAVMLASSLTCVACDIPEEGMQVVVDGETYTVKKATKEEAQNAENPLEISTEGGKIQVVSGLESLEESLKGQNTDNKEEKKEETKEETKEESKTDKKEEAKSTKIDRASDPTDKGVTGEYFKGYANKVTTEVYRKKVYQTGTVDGIDYSLTLLLSDWEKNTSEEQLGEITKLFWQAYPEMYSRFGYYAGAPVNVVISIEAGRKDVINASGSYVYLQDEYLKNYPTDYDVITRSLANIIQVGWNSKYLEYSAYVERFADYCRYVYAYNDGQYNDQGCVLEAPLGKLSRETSARFYLWLDEYFGTDKDIMFEFFKVCIDQEYKKADWDKAWAQIFKGTELEGCSIDKVWDWFQSAPFAKAGASAPIGQKSELIEVYNVRNEIKGRIERGEIVAARQQHALAIVENTGVWFLCTHKFQSWHHLLQRVPFGQFDIFISISTHL